MFERLPTPWGLVRSGVAPDHPKIKSVTRIYEKTAAHPRFRYFGNVELGSDITRAELARALPRDRLRHGLADRPAARHPRRGPPGKLGRHGLRRLVQRASGLSATSSFDLSAERAVVIGNGNVALDVARMLMLSHERALQDRHRRPRARGARAELASARSSSRAAAGPPRRRSPIPSCASCADIEDVDVVVDPDELERALAVDDPNMSRPPSAT